MNTNRRNFMTSAAAAVGFSAIAPHRAFSQQAKVGANDKITVAGIGLGPRGREVIKSFLSQADVRFVAIADVQKERSEIIRKTVNRHYGNEDCKAYSDMQEILGRDDIDAVLIATGDRWHGTASIMAARAGKDIYCEKPCTMGIAECRELDEAVLTNKRIYQGGMQRRNVDNFQLAAHLARTGRLGKLKTLHAGIWLPQPVKANLPAELEPDAGILDWNRWVGPAPARPYNLKYVRSQWRHYEGFSAGWGLHDWASHTVNLCQWAVAADDTTPVEFWLQDDQLRGRYSNGVELVMRLAGFKDEGGWLGLGSCPVRFEGEKGWVEAGDFSKIACSEGLLAAGEQPAEMFGIDPSKHVREFLDSIKSRKATACNSSIVRTTEVACHAAAISWKLGRKLRFDPAKESFIDDAEANALCSYQRRPPFTV
jgi:predicted dehydrogenase